MIMKNEPIGLDSLRPKWTSDDAANIGRKIFEEIPGEQQPVWVATILLYPTHSGTRKSSGHFALNGFFLGHDSGWISKRGGPHGLAGDDAAPEREPRCGAPVSAVN